MLSIILFYSAYNTNIIYFNDIINSTVNGNLTINYPSNWFDCYDNVVINYNINNLSFIMTDYTKVSFNNNIYNNNIPNIYYLSLNDIALNISLTYDIIYNSSIYLLQKNNAKKICTSLQIKVYASLIAILPILVVIIVVFIAIRIHKRPKTKKLRSLSSLLKNPSMFNNSPRTPKILIIQLKNSRLPMSLVKSKK